RRGGVRDATDEQPNAHDGLLLLDPESAGAVPVRRLRRGSRGSRQGEGAALGLSRPDPVTRLLLLHRADGGSALREGILRRADRVARPPESPPGTTARV